MSGLRLVLNTDLRSVLWGPYSGFGEDKSKDMFFFVTYSLKQIYKCLLGLITFFLLYIQN